MEDTYIHYGHKSFNPNEFEPIRNFDVKPKGGLWASPINAKFGWKDWCEREKFEECHPDNAFIFRLKTHANVLVIDNVEVLNTLPQIETCFTSCGWVCLDFKKIAKEYDAVELILSKDRQLYWKLYGWDCDSIVILNKDVIEEVRA